MKQKLNIFNHLSPMYPYRWFIVVTLSVMLFMLYHDLTGGRIFSPSGQQQWNSSGPGYHK